MSRLAGKVCVITGASTGIGRATLERFAAEGATVVGAARTQSTLDEALASALTHGGTGMVIAGDLSTEEACKRLIDETVETYGRIDVLVNNAGVGWEYGITNPGSMAALHETTHEWWVDVMKINLESYFNCSRFTLQQMITPGQRLDRQRRQHGRRDRALRRAHLHGGQGRHRQPHPVDGDHLHQERHPHQCRVPGIHRHPDGRGRDAALQRPGRRQHAHPHRPPGPAGGGRQREPVLRIRGRELLQRFHPPCRRRLHRTLLPR